jgi:hypothetical protein
MTPEECVSLITGLEKFSGCVVELASRPRLAQTGKWKQKCWLLWLPYLSA